MRDPHKIFKRLYKHFGPQHWWPADSPFEVMIGAVLTQNTSWHNVEKAIDNLKRCKALSPERIVSLSVKKLAFHIKPAGYYNLKAARLKNLARFFLGHYQGNIRKMSEQGTALLRQELLSVNGIGDETADSILLYALDKPVFVVDAYTKRICSRHGLTREDASYAEVQNFFMHGLPQQRRLFNEFHALLVRLGKDFCRKNKPQCDICPLKH